MKLYLKLKEIRLSKNFTQKELGDLIGLPYQNISAFERGTAYPSLERAMQIATILECTIDDLIDTERYMKEYHYFLDSLTGDE